MKRILWMAALIFIITASAVFYLASCAGGGGGGVDNGNNQDLGGSGTGAGSIPVFSWKYGAGDFGIAQSVVELPDNTYVFAGLKQPQDLPVQMYVVKTDSTGNVISENTYTSLDNSSGGAIGNCIRQTDDQGLIIAGSMMYAGAPHFYLMKTDGNGRKIWSEPYPGAVSVSGGFQSVWQTKTGGVADGYIAVGSIPGSMDDIYLLKTDLTGSVLWDAKLGGYGPDHGLAVQQTADGGFAVAGEFDHGAQSGTAVLYKTDSHGAETWSRKYGPGIFASFVQTTGGGFVLVGRTPDAGGMNDVLVVLTDSSGNEVRRRTFGGSDNDSGDAIALTQDGGYIVAGSTNSYSPGTAPLNADIFLIKLKPNLDTEWLLVKGRTDSGDGGSGVIATADGGYLVSGSLGGAAMLTKFDKNGDTIIFDQNDFTYRPSDHAAGVITMGNAKSAAGAAATSFDITNKVGSFSVDLLGEVLKGNTPESFCTGGGSYASTLSTSGTVTAGTIFTADFTNCVITQSSATINGSFSMIVNSVSGDIMTTTYRIDCTINVPTLSFRDNVGELTHNKCYPSAF